jgi:hypothetical protein
MKKQTNQSTLVLLTVVLASLQCLLTSVTAVHRATRRVIMLHCVVCSFREIAVYSLLLVIVVTLLAQKPAITVWAVLPADHVTRINLITAATSVSTGDVCVLVMVGFLADVTVIALLEESGSCCDDTKVIVVVQKIEFESGSLTVRTREVNVR